MNNKNNIRKLVLVILFLLLIDGFGYVLANGFKSGIIFEKIATAIPPALDGGLRLPK